MTTLAQELLNAVGQHPGETYGFFAGRLERSYQHLYQEARYQEQRGLLARRRREDGRYGLYLPPQQSLADDTHPAQTQTVVTGGLSTSVEGKLDAGRETLPQYSLLVVTFLTVCLLLILVLA